jgi:hypothetical protein
MLAGDETPAMILTLQATLKRQALKKEESHKGCHIGWNLVVTTWR